MRKLIFIKKAITFALSIALLSSITTVNIFASSQQIDEKQRQKILDERVKQYLTQDQIDFYKNIDKIKKSNPTKTTEEIVKSIDWTKREGPKESSEIQTAAAEGSTLADTWNNLTPAEKSLVVRYPSDAMLVHADQIATDQQVMNNYGWHKDGAEPNAFRHAVWNAFMARDVGLTVAELFATAHEDVTGKEYVLTDTWNHHTGAEHRDMDLNNNAQGRSVVSWSDVFNPPSDGTLVNRVILDKLREGYLTILNDIYNCNDCVG